MSVARGIPKDLYIRAAANPNVSFVPITSVIVH